MSVTIKDALTTCGLQKSRLVAGHGGINNIISYAGTMEIPNIAPWLFKRQLLITTGYAIKNSPEAIIKLVQELHDAKASGLAIKTKFTGAIPVEAIDLANKLNMPIIEIPPEVPFEEMITPLSNAIANEQNLKIEYSQKIHSKFMELELNGGGIQNISNMINKLLGLPVSITDETGNTPEMIVDSAHFGSRDEFSKLFSQEKPSIDEFFYGPRTTDTLSVNRDGKNSRYIMRKISLKNKLCGCIFIDLKEKTLDETEMIVIDHAATVVALEFSKNQALAEQTKLLENHFFIDIITGNTKSKEEAEYRAKNLKWPLPPFDLIVFDVDKFEDLAKKKSENQLYNIKESINKIINDHMNKELIDVTVILKSDSFTCLVPATFQKEKIKSVIFKIQADVYENFKMYLTAGVCEDLKHYLDLYQAYKDARDAIFISRIENRAEKMVFIADAKLEQALMSVSGNEYFKEYINKTINIIDEYDKENNTQLTETLTQLINCMGVRTKTAEKLFLHRNTLTYRIKKIEALTGCNLSRSEELLSLGIAMKIRPFSTYYSSVL